MTFMPALRTVMIPAEQEPVIAEAGRSATMKYTLLIIASLLLFGCKPTAQRDLETKIEKAAQQHLPLKEIISICGQPTHIYTQDEVRGYLENTSKSDTSVYKTWSLFLHYPRVAYYAGPATFQNYIFIDEAGRAAGYHFDSQ